VAGYYPVMRHFTSVVLVGFLALFLGACSLTAPPRTTPPPQRTPPSQPAPIPRPPSETPPVTPPTQPTPEVTTPPTRLPPPSSTVREHQLSGASKALVSQAQTQVASGDFPVAVSTIERALRIEPANPLLWIELGKVHQAARNYAQAESTARKALSVASNDLRAQSSAWQLIAQSLRARGKAQAAQQAEERALALMPD
jgi:hypothetical protein